MGRPSRALGADKPLPPPVYRDDEGEAADALSMHTTASDYEYDDLPTLPSYSDSEDAATQNYQQQQRQRYQDNAGSSSVLRPYAGEADMYAAHKYPTVQLGRNNVRNTSLAVAIGDATSIRMEEPLMDSDVLLSYCASYLRNVPPSQYVRVQGWHWARRRRNDGKNDKERVFDFDIVFNLAEYLPKVNTQRWHTAKVAPNHEKTYRGGFLKKRAPGARAPDDESGETALDAGHTPMLDDWCRDFCGSKAWLKIFRVTRTVENLDHEVFREKITPLVRGTHYRGHLDITFPAADKYVEIYSPHWINKLRISWVRWIFYLSFLWLLTWPILWLMTRQWAVYHVRWNWSRWVSPEELRVGGTAPPPHTKVYATVSEEEWVAKHAALIKNLVAERFQGDATELPTDVDPRPAPGSLPSTGNQNIDTAAAILHGGIRAWNAVSGHLPGGGWGGDEH